MLRTLQARGYITEVGRDTGPGQAMLFGTTPTFLEKLGLDSLDDLPPIAEFVPGADVVEALEHGLRVDSTSGRRPDAEPTTLEPPLWEQWAAQERRSCRRVSGCRRCWPIRGWGSRRVCEDLIAAGRVTVNGEVAVLGRRVDPEHDLVEVDGVPIGVQPGLVYYLLNKPAGVVTTASDTHGRPTVVELVPDEPRVFPVGRLDVDTEGLLLLTNDGELAHRLTHPSHGVEKEYLAEVAGGNVAPGRAAPAARGRRARRRHDRAGQGLAAQPGRAADHDPRGPQPPGAADVRGDRPSGAAARAGADRDAPRPQRSHPGSGASSPPAS